MVKDKAHLLLFNFQLFPKLLKINLAKKLKKVSEIMKRKIECKNK